MFDDETPAEENKEEAPAEESASPSPESSEGNEAD